jgi:NhaA family Na+:H+ antiporter
MKILPPTLSHHPSKSVIEEQFEELLSPIEKFTKNQISTGLLLAIASVMGMVIINSPLRDSFLRISEYSLGIFLESGQFSLPIHEWISAGLMAIFFLYIGLELKREMLVGELRHFRQSTTVLCAAIGGMVVPGLIYLAFNHGTEYVSGWAIPMATDAAFALGALALLSRRASPMSFAFLAALAIVDDLGSVMIIATFYAHEINIVMIGYSMITFACLLICNVSGVRNTGAYMFFGIILWYFVFQSGIHATVAGILVAMSVPARPKVLQVSFIRRAKALLFMMDHVCTQRNDILEAPEQHNLLQEIKEMTNKASTPLQAWELKLKPRVTVYILPIFALFNAGVLLNMHNLENIHVSPVVLGIFFGLLFGKPLGITLFTWLALKSNLGRLPKGLTMQDVWGISFLGGMGFTMALLLADISFASGSLVLEQAKLAILCASISSGILGLLCLVHRPRPHKGEKLKDISNVSGHK